MPSLNLACCGRWTAGFRAADCWWHCAAARVTSGQNGRVSLASARGLGAPVLKAVNACGTRGPGKIQPMPLLVRYAWRSPTGLPQTMTRARPRTAAQAQQSEVERSRRSRFNARRSGSSSPAAVAAAEVPCGKRQDNRSPVRVAPLGALGPVPASCFQSLRCRRAMIAMKRAPGVAVPDHFTPARLRRPHWPAAMSSGIRRPCRRVPAIAAVARSYCWRAGAHRAARNL